jgi:hypothetical protein
MEALQMAKRGTVADQFIVKVKVRPDPAAPKGRIEKVTYKLYDTGKVYAGRFHVTPHTPWEEFKQIKLDRSRELDEVETDMAGRIL